MCYVTQASEPPLKGCALPGKCELVPHTEPQTRSIYGPAPTVTYDAPPLPAFISLKLGHGVVKE